MSERQLIGLPEGGLYVLVIEMCQPRARRFGALGRQRMEAGWYLYTGTAVRGLRQRIKRHLAGRKPLHWHIDYLTSIPQARMRAIVTIPVAAGLTECALNRAVGEMSDGSQPIPGFGANDCRSDCGAHLWRSESSIGLEQLSLLHPRARVLAFPR